jgi:N-acylneuraminate cytidylyltransferase
MKIAIIPARGGSKRIPRKNIKEFNGVPLIAWSITAAKESQCFDQIIVSTDDEEIREIARAYGAAAPFTRPSNLSDDYTGTVPVIAHAVDWINRQGNFPEEVCCIYPTAPFIRSSDIIIGLRELKKSDADFAVSITSYCFPIQRALRVVGDQKIEMTCAENFSVRSQDLEELWHDAGQFYWGKASSWLRDNGLFCGNTIGVQLPRFRVQDIDTEEDWLQAELMHRSLRNS